MEDYSSLKTDSHMLKHNILKHKELENVEFDMKVLKEHQSALQRQIHEAVLLQNYTGACLMNSKSEYSRSRIPRLTVKFVSTERKKSG